MRIVVLTGAGMSAESGLKTFRDSNGLWEGHDVMEVASPQGFAKDPELVLDFYNQRRRQLLTVAPNEGHLALAALEKDAEVVIITQNVDDLHERAGSTKVLHLHGELLKARNILDEHSIVSWKKDIHLGDCCEAGHQLRPHVVWFGEAVPMMNEALVEMQQAELVIVIGTSMQVYPAAGLMQYTPEGCPVYFIDPNPSIRATDTVEVIAQTATQGIPKVIETIRNEYLS
ncbi:SIR2 family NAD-dependent protein deacylase [Altibacter sp. HG106]|uniref:SIR2 family NAD-dependent protein deacylase n=1 Tax=Altibacter sp. HG106 TaxID=3023937 RepID=UPI00235064D9|nr:NAD-dependent deacylase [Altibacter sp. HG106]MDC7993744.1 NAD-dependent deacylase [Altibacter sp. HG106]